MKKLNPSQQKNIIATVITVAVLIAAGVFIYLPEHNKLDQIKEQLTAVEYQIRQVQGAADTNKAIEEKIKALQARYQFVESKFPSREYEALRLLSDFARKVNIDILSIRSEPKAMLLDEDQQKIEADGKVCQKLPVSVELKCRYQDLLIYMAMLKESLPSYVMVEGLRVRKDETGASKLNITLDLILYLLSA